MDTNKKQIFVFFEEYKQLFVNILEDEKDKLKKFLTFDLEQINEAIKKQQSNEMRIANVEKKRIKMQIDLGYENMTFRDIINSLEDKEEFEIIYKEIDSLVQEVKYYNFKAMEIAKSQIKMYGTINERTYENNNENKTTIEKI